MQFLGKHCGWRAEEIDGIFAPGGSMANIYGMILARHRKFPELKREGLAGLDGELVMFCSEDAHYSFVKGSIWMGQGSKSVIKVKSDAKGRLDAAHLKLAIASAITAGKLPYMVACTAGTTVLGAFDPIDEVVSVCKHYDLWLHVDAALGGTVLFSKTHRDLMRGIESADSMTWNLHKLGVSGTLSEHAKAKTFTSPLKLNPITNCRECRYSAQRS